MIDIGGRPILWHVMHIYTAHGVTDFIVCLGYRGYMIKEYFANYVMHEADLTVDWRSGEITYHTNYATLAGDPGRYRPDDHDRRAAEARGATWTPDEASA